MENMTDKELIKFAHKISKDCRSIAEFARYNKALILLSNRGYHVDEGEDCEKLKITKIKEGKK